MVDYAASLEENRDVARRLEVDPYELRWLDRPGLISMMRRRLTTHHYRRMNLVIRSEKTIAILENNRESRCCAAAFQTKYENPRMTRDAPTWKPHISILYAI